VDTFSISSYSSAGDPFDSVLAHGTVDNLTVTAQLQPITRLTGSPTTNGFWQAQFFAHSNWLYTLERSADLHSWAPASAAAPGNDDFITLQDTNTPAGRAFYRVHAEQP
jgi:WD40 repeat protein